MPKVEIIQPISQTVGEFRLLNWLTEQFNSGLYDSFKCLTAFAKVKPLYKIHDNIRNWKAAGKSLEAIFGIDHKGTSVQVLQYALSNFDHTYILHAAHSTFHPKLYIFTGAAHAAVYCGSNNLTPGGLETNFEGGVLLTLTLPEDADLLAQAVRSFDSLLPPAVPCCTELSAAFLKQLNDCGLLLDENVRKPRKAAGAGAAMGAGADGNGARLFAAYRTKPPKAISKAALEAAAKSAGIGAAPGPLAAAASVGMPVTGAIPAGAGDALDVIIDKMIMQVNPGDKGEMLLSKKAVAQNPHFFGFPFTGKTVPKKATNPTYPQREPDPIVNIYVYDSTGRCVNTEVNYNLNMVYYEKKEEIRITITLAILAGLNYNNGPDYPIMVMERSEVENCDYDLHFYAKGSEDYDNYLAVCNQTLPSGGKTVARKMGWI